MSLARVVAVAVAIVLAVVVWRSRGAGPVASAGSQATVPLAAPAVPAAPASPSAAAAPGLARATAPAAPELPDAAPFRDQDLAVTTDMPEGALIALRSSMRDGRNLAVELATREPAPEGTRVFAIVSVSDRLGNTILGCTWRDIEITDDARRLECELPLDVELPLAISGHQLPAPSFVEAPRVVAIDEGVHP